VYTQVTGALGQGIIAAGMRVRAGEIHDAKKLEALLESVLGKGLDAEESAQFARHLLYFLASEGNALLVLEDGDDLVGAVTVWIRQGLFDDLPTARVDRLLLSPTHNTEAAALMLLEQAAALARSVGAGDFEVLTDTDLPLEPGFFERLGMTALGAYRARIR